MNFDERGVHRERWSECLPVEMPGWQQAEEFESALATHLLLEREALPTRPYHKARLLCGL